MKHVFYFLVLLALSGCNTFDKPKKPQDLIPKDKMSDIMYDLYILNAAKGINRKVLELNGIMPTEHVYKKYGIDSLQFAQSNTYYAYDTEVYSALVEKVKVELEREKVRYEKLTNEEQRVKDSVRKVEKKPEISDQKDSIDTLEVQNEQPDTFN